MKCILELAGPLVEDRDFMFAAVSKVSLAYEVVGAKLSSDRDLVLLAIKETIIPLKGRPGGSTRPLRAI